jgi:hypothetical protein
VRSRAAVAAAIAARSQHTAADTANRKRDIIGNIFGTVTVDNDVGVSVVARRECAIDARHVVLATAEPDRHMRSAATARAVHCRVSELRSVVLRQGRAREVVGRAAADARVCVWHRRIVRRNIHECMATLTDTMTASSSGVRVT